MEPRVLGEYHLLAKLAEGGMGDIHLARKIGFAPEIQHFCAIKTLHKNAESRSMLQRFYDEARIVVTLNHRAICHVFDVGVVSGEHFLAMELIEGVSLHRLSSALADAKRKLEPALALFVLDEILDALQYAHEHHDPVSGAPLRIVHRDVSPHNVMLSFSGAVKLIDFGLVSSTVKSERTVGGVVVGKIGYMSPEQARGEALDARTDVYAAAVVLVELLTGRRFYEGLTKNQIMMELVEGTFAPRLDDVPAPLREPLRRALAPEPKDRTPSCGALQTELAAAQATWTRASSRDLRALLLELFPDERGRLQRLVRGVQDARVDDEERTRTLAEVTTIARSEPSAPSWTPTHDDDATAIAPAPPPANARRSALPLVATALASAVVTVGAWAMVSARGTAHDDIEDPPPLRVEARVARVDAGVALVVEAPPPPPPADEQARDAGAVEEEAPELPVQEPAVVDGKEPLRAKAVKKTKPPLVALPDLAAQLDYVAKWCRSRAPVCSRSVLARRTVIAQLDPAGLRALRLEATSCIEECRR
jgi:serine/threonine-protein kinase